MPWTTHGYWTGLRAPDPPGPPRLDCGGPHRCTQCALEAQRAEYDEAPMTVDQTPPPIGTIVHYTTCGTPGGEYGRECRPAMITELPRPIDEQAHAVGLAIFYPTGLGFTRAVAYHDGGGDAGDPDYPERGGHGVFRYCPSCSWTDGGYHGGTWHLGGHS